MANTISNISEISDTISIENAEPLTHTEEVQVINKVKYGLSLAYFTGITILMTTLFI